jgi:RNA polymerase sigma-70 factor (ECF subfamily)
MSFDIDLKQLSDEQAFRLVKDGDTAAFDELYHRYSHRLLHYLLRLLNGNESRAQDLLQDVFLKILDKRNQFRDTEKFSTWVFTITHNLCKNEFRSSETRRTGHFADRDYSGLPTENPLISGMDKIDYENFTDSIYRLLKSLPADQRSTFLLRFQENLSIPEIAGIMNCPAGTVKSRLHNTLCLIAERLKVYDPNKSEVV